MSALYIEPKSIVGKTFTAFDPNTEYTCIGYASNETFLVVGSNYDSVNNRSTVKTFKLQDVKFKGELAVT